jgi:capsular polysaccharide biosynthesis protein
MENKEISSLFKNRKKTIFYVAFIFLILVMIVTFLRPLEYRATTKILVTQSYGPASDAYSVSKSNQFISNVLAQIIYSDLFFDDVLKSGYNIDQNYFSGDDGKRKKQWQNMVKVIVLNDAGVIIAHTYHVDKYQANQINQAIAYTIKTKHSQYHGFGSKLSVKIIDKTIVSRFPVKPNVILNAVFGIIIGIVLGIVYAYLNPEKRKVKKMNLKEDVVNQDIQEKVEVVDYKNDDGIDLNNSAPNGDMKNILF